MQEFTFEEARKLLEEGKCTKICYKSWCRNDKYNHLYLYDDKLCWEDDEQYHLGVWQDWKSYPWYCLDLKPEVEIKIGQQEEPKQMKEITQYIYRNRNGNRAKVGLLYATTEGNRIMLGYSLCSPEDKFSRDKALSIAKGRALDNVSNIIKCPPSINREVAEFIERSKKYFKTTEFHTYVF